MQLFHHEDIFSLVGHESEMAKLIAAADSVVGFAADEPSKPVSRVRVSGLRSRVVPAFQTLLAAYTAWVDGRNQEAGDVPLVITGQGPTQRAWPRSQPAETAELIGAPVSAAIPEAAPAVCL